jgi:hypothetical protein
MSTTLEVYAVSLDELRRVAGSRDEGLISAIVVEQASWLAEIDAIRDVDEEEAGETLTCAQALAQIINGEIRAEVPWYQRHLYGYALEALCGHLGEPLENVSAITGASGWVDEVDAFLIENDVPIRLSDLMFGKIPLEIPEPDDYPCIGSWSAGVIAGALVPLRRIGGNPEDPEMAETIGQLRDWIEAAASRPGYGLVGFLS